MPKQKPHKGLASRVKVSAKGKVRFKRTNAGHLMSVKESKRKRRFRRDRTMSKANNRRSLEALR